MLAGVTVTDVVGLVVGVGIGWIIGTWLFDDWPKPPFLRRRPQ